MSGAATQRTGYRQGYFSLVTARVRFERWDLVDRTSIPVYDKLVQQAWRLWATGLAVAAQGVRETRATDRRMKAHPAPWSHQCGH